MIEEALAKFIESQLAAKLGADYKKFRDYIIRINKRNEKLAAEIAEKEARISQLEKICADLANEHKKECAGFANELKTLSARIAKFEKEEAQAAEAAANAVISTFNSWAAHPVVPLPRAFSFIAGDFRIRTKQHIIQTPDESKWITNREGHKKYLLPNPNSFNQMTASDFLYKINGTAKAKGQNRVRLIKPCEMTNEGWVEFAGELEILPQGKKMNERDVSKNDIKAAQEVYTAQSETLAASNRELAEAIRQLAEERRKENAASIESLVNALDAQKERIETLCVQFEQAGKTLEGAYQKLNDYIKINKPELSVINKLAGEVAQLRKALTTHTTPAENAAIQKISAVCETLEQNVCGTWTSITETLTRNAKDLSQTYEHFFELCKTISQNTNEWQAVK